MIKHITDRKLWVAPLAGITDQAYRTICKEHGADLLVSEMISADGLVYNKEKSLEYAFFTEDHRPFGMQIFGDNPQIMAQGTEILLKGKPDFIDINMGCPVKKVIKRGAGSALMKTPELAYEIVKSIKSVLAGTEIPLSVKFRAGWDSDSINYLEYAEKMCSAGADILILHPRTRSQMFSGASNWDYIKELKSNFQIPVVGNGDIRNAFDAVEMLNKTGCDSVMIGRGLIGNPWIFEEIKHFQKTGEQLFISSVQKFETIKKHLELAIKWKGERRALPEMRSHLSNYTKGLQGGASARKDINTTLDFDLIIEILHKLFLGE